MPDNETPVTEQPKQSFTDFRAARGTTPQEPIPLEATAISKPDPKSAPPAESDPASGQSNVEKRKSEIQKDIDAQVARRETAKREADAEEARLAKVRGTEVPRGTGAQEQPATAPAATTFDGTDPKDPRPERPKKPLESDYKDRTWAEYQAAKDKYDDDIISFMSQDAAWTARAEWRKADAGRQQKDAVDAQKALANKDLADFEATAQKWAKGEGAEDFDGLFAEIKKRPVLSPETGSVTMYGGEDGARLLYHLMTNPDELEDIEKMPRAIDRLNKLYELKHTLKPSARPAQERPRSAAPAAGTRVNGAGGGGSTKIDSFQKYRANKFGT